MLSFYQNVRFNIEKQEFLLFLLTLNLHSVNIKYTFIKKL